MFGATRSVGVLRGRLDSAVKSVVLRREMDHVVVLGGVQGRRRYHNAHTVRGIRIWRYFILKTSTLHNQIQEVSRKRLKKLKIQEYYYSIQCRNPNQCVGRLPGQGTCDHCKTKVTEEKEQ